MSCMCSVPSSVMSQKVTLWCPTVTNSDADPQKHAACTACDSSVATTTDAAATSHSTSFPS
eukprot:CAMPEP_0180158084 /NCGR_PEP_ID=MMETSP0986-20121125/26676_1 /TAXON_ID=697907 /ORGANISM="non described non described, Strain CCMP2293" /LENGTH=60 /DNA_ID=CAMNT_0022107827 /DNA_START=185 /DNA_END=364 /DNA_ORIENTATION=+